MRRGDVVTVADRSGEFTGKPRPAVLVQNDLVDVLDTVAMCPITSVDPGPDVRRFRFELMPSDHLPLRVRSWIEVDKIFAARRRKLGRIIGRVSDAELARITRALAILLAIA